MERPTIIMTLGSGGYGFQSTRLANNLKHEADLVFLTGKFGRFPPRGGLPESTCYKLPTYQTITSGNMVTNMASLVGSFFVAIKAIIKHKPAVVIGLGMRQSVAVLFAARLLGKQAIYVESITRVSKPSLTAKTISRFRLSNRIFVQWPDLQPQLKRSEYVGSIIS